MTALCVNQGSVISRESIRQWFISHLLRHVVVVVIVVGVAVVVVQRKVGPRLPF